MKVYKVEVMVIDFDQLGMDGIKVEMENVRYPNDCMSPKIVQIMAADIGEWHDDHPLNKRDKWADEYLRLFPA